MRGLGLALSMGLVALAPRIARADSCLDAYDGSQRARRAGQLLEARRQLLVCAQPVCPEAVAKECTLWLREVSESLPTVVLGVRDASGNDVTEVRVTTGDRLLTKRLDGRAVPLDPGTHRLHFELADGRALEKEITVREGEKNRLVQVELAPAKATRAEPRKEPPARPVARTRERGVPTLAIVLGSVGVAALGSFVYFAIDARSDVNDMERSCKPGCPQSEVDRAARKALVADISLGVGVVALGAAGWVVLARPEPASSSIVPRGGFLGVGTRL